MSTGNGTVPTAAQVKALRTVYLGLKASCDYTTQYEPDPIVTAAWIAYNQASKAHRKFDQ
jgi:hypothetical protein